MSAKVRKIIGILDRIRVKYLFSAAALLLFAQLVFGSSVPRGMLASAAEDSLRQRLSDSLRIHSEAAAEVPEAATQSRRDRREQARAAREQARRRAAFEALPQEQLDSLITQKGDSLEGRGADTIARDTVKEKKPQKPGAFLDDPISGKNKDSLVYDVRNKMVYIYNEGDITYQNSNLKADYMQINMDNKMVYAYGKPDSLEGKPIVTKPEFSEGDAIVHDGYDHLQPHLEEGQDQGRGNAAGRRLAGRREREEDARQHGQHRKRQIHDLRRDRPPALLPGDDQSQGHPWQESRHGAGLPRHGGRADLLSRHPRGFLPDQHGATNRVC